jgi:hypothetical protein
LHLIGIIYNLKIYIHWTMFNSEPKLFSIGTISLPLEILEIVVFNTVVENYLNYKF